MTKCNEGNDDDYFKQKHYYLEITSDNKGYPTEYLCINCGKRFKILSRDKKAREYLKQKYSSQTA